MAKSVEEHAANWDLRDPDFGDHDFLYRVYAAMREAGPFAHTDTPFLGESTNGAWVATRYAECYEILRDWQSFSNQSALADVPQSMSDAVITIDPPRQQKLRKVLNPLFAPDVMTRLEPSVRAVTDELIDEFVEKGQGDLAHVAWRQPGIVFFEYLLGMPVEQVPLYIELTDTALNGDDLNVRATAGLQLYEHVRDEIEARRAQPVRDDMISELLSAEIDGEPLPFDTVVANVMLLVQAGLETTSSAMSFAFHYLGTNADAREQLVRDPSLIPGAVEEFVRFAGSVHGLHRVAAGEIEVSGHRFCPGDSIIVNYAAANRDPREFDDADRCVLDRQTNRHLGFGLGPHRCLGSNLARLEFRVGLEQVLSRMPDFAVHDEGSVVFRGNSVTRGYHVLPVKFTPKARVR
jgi:cytochrome P450